MIKVLIVDDEPLARENLRVFLQEQSDIEIVGECSNAVEGIGAVHKLRPDVLFLDIQMPRISGLEMVGMLDPEHRPYIVFLTAFDEYAIKAFEEHAFDYLLKPINYTLLQEALKNVVERIQRRKDKPAGSAEQPKDSLLPANTLNVSNPYIRQLLHVLSERLTENLPIPELADSMHLNPQYIMRLFKKEMGCSILQYITSRRIALAVQYLEDTNLPITEVALLCGFDNYSYFTRVFKRFTGQSPAAFRKRSVPPD